MMYNRKNVRKSGSYLRLNNAALLALSLSMWILSFFFPLFCWYCALFFCIVYFSYITNSNFTCWHRSNNFSVRFHYRNCISLIVSDTVQFKWVQYTPFEWYTIRCGISALFGIQDKTRITIVGEVMWNLQWSSVRWQRKTVIYSVASLIFLCYCYFCFIYYTDGLV